jgi:UDP:flavonoid glycosyltransferase YjiC (YdhE family)
MNGKKNIMVAPLNWGIGHATRCIPIIKQLKKNNFNVTIMSSGRSLNLLIKEFPDENFIKLEDYNVTYSNFLPMQINIFLQIPKIIFGIYTENRKLKSIIKDYEIDGIISDNRYGLYSNKVPSVFITHQIKIQTPFLKELVKKIKCYFINKTR